MLRWIDPQSLEFASPEYLWLLVAPGLLLVAWVWQLLVRRVERARVARQHVAPTVPRIPLIGGLGFWLCVDVALVLLIVALAGPRAVASIVRTSGVDLVVLQDGSASMHVDDAQGTRWQRANRFLRTLGEAISWDKDRLAMAVFARIATPQVRLTRDPNTFFFFVDHLGSESPFRLQDETSWDTNIESGLYWGLKLFERDEQLHGRSANAKAFVLISDGQAWSGEVATSLALTTARKIPVVVIGVGTTAGGPIPEPPPSPDQPAATPAAAPIHSVLDRTSLVAIANRGAGQYFELGRAADRAIAADIVQRVRRQAPVDGVERAFSDLYWPVLAIAAGVLCVGVLFLQAGAELWLHAIGSALVLLLILSLTR